MMLFLFFVFVLPSCSLICPWSLTLLIYKLFCILLLLGALYVCLTPLSFFDYLFHHSTMVGIKLMFSFSFPTGEFSLLKICL